MSSNHLSPAPLPGSTPAPLTLVPGAGGVAVEAELQPIFAAVGRIVDAWAPLFKPVLTGRVVFTIQPGRGRTLGWFCPDRWQRKTSGECLPDSGLAGASAAGWMCPTVVTIAR